MSYLEDFPLPEPLIPAKLRALLEPVPLDRPHLNVDVATFLDQGPDREAVQMQMLVVPTGKLRALGNLNTSSATVVDSPVRMTDRRGALRRYNPLAWGFDPIVMSWGTGSFFAYNLSEKVWMSLGLSPRCFGNSNQRVVYDDQAAPEFGVAGGEISSAYYFKASRNVSWTMRNDFLRRYLWMRGAAGVRVFFYQRLLDDHPDLRAIMGGQAHYVDEQEGSWYLLDLRESQGRLLMQVWATVPVMRTRLCPEVDVHRLVWPGDDAPMGEARLGEPAARTQRVYLKDQILERYQQNEIYTTVPRGVDGQWLCSPSYKGQWAFGGWRRVGRHFITVSAYDIYDGVPDREIRHVHACAIDPNAVGNLDEEHIVAKGQRLLDRLLDLGDNLSALGAALGLPDKSADQLVGFSRAEIQANGWDKYPRLCRLAQVAPLDMTQQAFLSRCKTLHEILQRVPDSFLKKLLVEAGCTAQEIKSLGSIRLLQALTNVLDNLNEKQDDVASFSGAAAAIDWNARNETLAPLFVTNELRKADAHEIGGDWLLELENLDFDTAQVNDGYGRALDFVLDQVITSLASINERLGSLLER